MYIVKVIDYDYHTELVGYDLPDLFFPIETPYELPDNPNMALSIGIPVILILTTVIVVITLKKKNK